jgi:hypothetical protein
VDPMAVAGMIFVLTLVAMIGTFILLIPLSRRLGQVIDLWLGEKRSSARSEEIDDLRRSVLALESEVSSLTERQQFIDQLLEKKQRERLEP